MDHYTDRHRNFVLAKSISGVILTQASRELREDFLHNACRLDARQLEIEPLMAEGESIMIDPTLMQ